MRITYVSLRLSLYVPAIPDRVSNLAWNPERHYPVGIVYRYRKPRPRATKGKCILHNLLFERETIPEIPAAARHRAVSEETNDGDVFEKSDKNSSRNLPREN